MKENWSFLKDSWQDDQGQGQRQRRKAGCKRTAWKLDLPCSGQPRQEVPQPCVSTWKDELPSNQLQRGELQLDGTQNSGQERGGLQVELTKVFLVHAQDSKRFPSE
jgi:hypothetical protein